MKLTIKGRLTTLVLMSLLSVALLGYLFVSQSEKDISFAQRELQGTAYLQALAPDLVAQASGKPLPSVEKLASVSSKLDSDLGTSAEAKAYFDLRLSQTGVAFTPEFRAAAGTLLAKIGDASNLILDPDLDSFYVMDLSVVRLPTALSVGSELMTALGSAAGSSAPSDDQRIALISGLGEFTSASEGVANSLASAIAGNGDGSVKANLSLMAARSAIDAESFSQKMGAASVLVGTAAAAKPLTEVQAAFSAYNSSANDLLAASLIELTGLLKARVNAMVFHMTLMLSLSGALVLMVFLISWLFARSIVRTIKRLEADILRLANDQQAGNIGHTDGKDEISAIARAVQYLRDKTVERLQDAESLRVAEEQRTVDVERAAAVERETSLQQVATRAKAQSLMVASLSETLQRLAVGDLDCRLELPFAEEFEPIRHTFNSTIDGLRDLIGQLKGTAQSIRSATSEILAGANDLAERTSRQAASIEDTSRSMAALSSTVEENAQRAKEALQNAEVVAATAGATGTVMVATSEAMSRIRESSGRIQGIVGLIDDVAFQTNLLALNASVEAARAGDAGKGFAVVAVEVRRLAQSASGASSDIKALIAESQSFVEDGAKLVLGATDKLQAMLAAAARNTTLMDMIAARSVEQSTAIGSVSTSIRAMDEMTQHNAALVEETNAAIEQTESQAHELDRLVDRFNLGKRRREVMTHGARAA